MCRRFVVFPVPGCMSPEEALAECELLGELVGQRFWWQRWWCFLVHGRRRWAFMECGVDE